MIIGSKTPLRLGLAGGGTDITSYYDRFGGYVLYATIDMYAYCTIEPNENGKMLDFREESRTSTRLLLAALISWSFMKTKGLL